MEDLDKEILHTEEDINICIKNLKSIKKDYEKEETILIGLKEKLLKLKEQRKKCLLIVKKS